MSDDYKVRSQVNADDSGPKGLPDWAKQPLRQFIEYARQEMQLRSLAMSAIARTQGMGQLAQALFDLDKSDRKRAQRGSVKKLKAAKVEAKLATEETKGGFPLLNAHALVGLWGALEALCEDLAVTFLMNESELLSNDRFARLRVPLAEFEALTREDRMRRVVALAQREFAAAAGATSFEQVLALVNLDGPVPDDLRKLLWEAENIRNMIVHRMSIADQRFADACPWLGYKPGDRVTVKNASAYGDGMMAYQMLVINRVRAHFGMKPYQSPESKASGPAAKRKPRGQVEAQTNQK